MALGVLNNLSAMYAENNLNNTSNSLQTVLQQLSSGSRINSGADDAAGLSLVNGLQANQTALKQSGTNATEGVGLLDVADGALLQVTNLLNRAITLSTEASNGTLNSTQEQAANQEYQSIMAEVSNIGSTTTYNQERVFTGNNVAIYTGDSSTTGSSLDELNIRQLSAASVGDSAGTMSYSNGANNVFLNLSTSAHNAATTDSLNASGATTINVSYVSKGSNGSADTTTTEITVGTGTNYANTVQGLMTAIDNAGLGLTASFTTAEQAGTAAITNAVGVSTETGIEISGQGVGAGSNAGVIGALTVNAAADPLSGVLNIVGSDGQTHNITLGTAGSTDTIANLENTINGNGFGVTATVNANVLTFTSAFPTVTVSGTGITDTTSATAADNPVIANVGKAGNVSGADGTITVNNKTAQLTGGTISITGDNNITKVFTLGTAGQTDNLTDLENTINAYDAANPAFGIGASVNGAGTVLTLTAAGSGLGATTTALTSALPTGTDPATSVLDPLTLTPSTITQVDTTPGTIGTLAIGTGGAGTDTLNAGAIYITGANGGTTTITAINNVSTLASLATTINGLNLGVSATVNGSTLIFASTGADSQASVSLKTAFADTQAGDTAATVTLAPTTNMPPNPLYYSVGLTSTFGVTDTTTNITDGDTSLASSNAGFATDDNGKGAIATISYSDSGGVALNSTDLLNQTDAQYALIQVNQAITDVAAQDGYIGAQINTLNSVSQVMSTQQENVVTAQNAIQATDYASATSNMSKYEILSQTGIAALAQANSVQQEVTKLLQ